MPSQALDQQPCPVAATRLRKEIKSLHKILQDYPLTLKKTKASTRRATTIDDLIKQIKRLKEFDFTADDKSLSQRDAKGKHTWLERKARAIELLSILLQYLILFDSTKDEHGIPQAKNRLKATISTKMKDDHNLSTQERAALQDIQLTITAIENLQKKYNSTDPKKINFSVAAKVFLIERKFKKYISEVTKKAIELQAAEYDRLIIRSQKLTFIGAYFHRYRLKATTINSAKSFKALHKALSLHRYPAYNSSKLPYARSTNKSRTLFDSTNCHPIELLASPLVTSPQRCHGNKYLHAKMAYIKNQCLDPTIAVNPSHAEKVSRLIRDRIDFHREQRGCYGLFNRLLNHHQKAKKLTLILNKIAAANTDRLSFREIIDIKVVIAWRNKSVSISLSQALNENRLGLFFCKHKTNGAKYIEQKTSSAKYIEQKKRKPATVAVFVNPCFTKA